MATFIEYKYNPRWTALYVLCVVLAIPLLECILFHTGGPDDQVHRDRCQWDGWARLSQ
jgi:hypothetical protein